MAIAAVELETIEAPADAPRIVALRRRGARHWLEVTRAERLPDCYQKPGYVFVGPDVMR